MPRQKSEARPEETDEGGGGPRGGAQQAGVGEGSEGHEGQGWSRHGSALEEQTWIMRQMWVTHTAVELELRLLRHSAEYAFDHVFWVPYDEWRGEQGSG